MPHVAAILMLASTIALPVVAANHTSSHDMNCLLGHEYTSVTTVGGGEYESDIEESCVLAVDNGSDVCLFESNSAHYETNPSSAVVHSHAFLCTSDVLRVSDLA